MVEPKNTTDNQNFDVDIEAIYQNFIIEIDKIRSFVNVQASQISFDNSISNLKIETTPQESRCHAFYRLIGLPVISADGQLYSPGVDQENNNDQSLIDKKKAIAKAISNSTNKIMNERELTVQNYLGIFEKKDITASALAMSSVDLRPFDYLKGEDPFDPDKKNQSYTVDLAKRLSTTVQGNPVLSSSRPHLLKPFMVDPRIDQTVNPSNNRLAVPFVLDKTKLKLSDNTYIKRPYLEKICRERLKVNSQEVLNPGSFIEGIINNIKNNDSIKNEKLISEAFNPDKKILTETVQFANYLNIIRSMLNKLSESVDVVLKVLAADPNSNNQAFYNWIPIPDKKGPEFKSQTRNLLTQQNDPSNTAKDKEIIEALYTKTLNELNNKLTVNTTADLGGFAFDSTEITPDPSSSNGWGDINQQSLDEMLAQRQHYTDEANSALRIIEIIMGEFSGLGLCDILAISAALWIVEKEVLVNLLDNTAINRILHNPGYPTLKSPEVMRMDQGRTLTAQQTISKLEAKIKEVYNIMDKMYQEIRSANKK